MHSTKCFCGGVTGKTKPQPQAQPKKQGEPKHRDVSRLAFHSDQVLAAVGHLCTGGDCAAGLLLRTQAAAASTST